MLIYAVVTITSALLFYTVGVWGEKLQRQLRIRNVVFFWLGLTFDTVGTTIMSSIAGEGFALNAHSVSGALAIALMLFHAIWATVVLMKKDEKMIANFHKFSVIVWLIWLVPYFSGMIVGMNLA